MHPSQDVEGEHPQLDDPIPALPVNHADSFQSHLNVHHGAAGIVDVLDNALPAGDFGGYSFHNSHGFQCVEALQDLDKSLQEQQEKEFNHHHQNIERAALNQNVNNSSVGYAKSDDQYYTVRTQDWACEKCGQVSSYKKVRCMVCCHWRDGKRPGTKLKPTILASDLEQPNMATIAAISASGKWICHNCSVINQKSRCSVCQSWKGARRHNLPRKSSVISTDDGPPETPWPCDRCDHINTKGKSRCSSCQHWKGGKRLNLRTKSHDDGVIEASRNSAAPTAVSEAEPPLYNINATWQCKCSRYNSTVRCTSCLSWKNCKGQLEFQRLMGANMQPINTDTLSPPSPPWDCIGCNHRNNAESEQCDSCKKFRNTAFYPYQQSLPNNQYNQLYNPTNQVNQHPQLLPTLPTMQSTFDSTASETPTAQVQQHPHSMPWVCPHCNRENLAMKVRCGGCHKWKGGVRESYKKKSRNGADQTWICRKCQVENSGKKVRCKVCQAWKDGGRPDVLGKNALAKEAHKVQDSAWWTCDRCGRQNKPRKKRCGSCQHWRGGCRPQMRKDATVASASHIEVPKLLPMQAYQFHHSKRAPTQDNLNN